MKNCKLRGKPPCYSMLNKKTIDECKIHHKIHYVVTELATEKVKEMYRLHSIELNSLYHRQPIKKKEKL